MQHDTLMIEFEGSEIPELYADLASLEVELDEDLAGMFRLTLAMVLKADGTWPYLDDERLTIWKKVVVTAGLEDDSQELITGYITHVRPTFGAGLDDCRLEICGIDATVLMDREDKRKDWPSKKDSDIATEIFNAYGLTPQVTDTSIVHDEQLSTIIQHETDIQFLKRLALRNGYECFVDGETAYFQPPQVSGTPQPVLAVQFGDDTTVNRFQLEVNAVATANAAMSQLDRESKDVLDAASVPGSQEALGASGADSFLGGGMTPGLMFVTRAVTTGASEMNALCQGLYY